MVNLPRHLSTRAGGRGGVIAHRRTCENLSSMLYRQQLRVDAVVPEKRFENHPRD